MAKDDLISRRAVLAALSSRLSIVDMVRVAEIVDVVEAEPVVRCKDCVHRRVTLHGRKVCILTGEDEFATDDDFYCAEGERRTDV